VGLPAFLNTHTGPCHTEGIHAFRVKLCIMQETSCEPMSEWIQLLIKTQEQMLTVLPCSKEQFAELTCLFIQGFLEGGFRLKS
jgi:hypothetical protein